MASEETKITSGSLIAAEKVEGTDVYNMQGEKLGAVDDIMLDKVGGKAIYAIVSFGGFLGIGEKYHPLPWTQQKVALHVDFLLGKQLDQAANVYPHRSEHCTVRARTSHSRMFCE